MILFILSRLLSLPGIDINAKDDEGLTAFDMLLENVEPEDEDILDLFKNLGKKLRIYRGAPFASAASYYSRGGGGSTAVRRCQWLLDNFPTINVHSLQYNVFKQ